MVYDYCGHCIITVFFIFCLLSFSYYVLTLPSELKNSMWTEMILLHCFSLCCWPAMSWCLDKWKRTEFVKYFLLQRGSQENFQSQWNCGLNNICYNRPLLSSKNPHFQNETRCTTFLVKMSFICMRMKNNLRIKGWAPTLVLKQRPRGTSCKKKKNSKSSFRAKCLNSFCRQFYLSETLFLVQL